MKKTIAFVFMICLVVSVGNAHALSILVSDVFYASVGYGDSSYDNWTKAVDGVSGDVSTTSFLTDYEQMLASDAIIVSMRYPSYTLSDTEKANLQKYAATGRRVLLVGENSQWGNWNTSIIDFAGGTYSGTSVDGSVAPDGTHELVSGVTSVYVHSGSQAAGGTSLFSESFANLWGADSNILTVQDINLFSDAYWDYDDNSVFVQNIVNWLAASNSAAPIPGAVWLLGSGLLGLAGIRWKRKG